MARVRADHGPPAGGEDAGVRAQRPGAGCRATAAIAGTAFLRAPAVNVVEIDHHGVDRLPEELRAQLEGLWDFNPQDDEQMSARLFVPE